MFVVVCLLLGELWIPVIPLRSKFPVRWSVIFLRVSRLDQEYVSRNFIVF